MGAGSFSMRVSEQSEATDDSDGSFNVYDLINDLANWGSINIVETSINHEVFETPARSND